MHFWIDKRSQACGFGRARVAASLSNSGAGLGFYPPRRSKSMSMQAPIHRLQSQDFARPTYLQHQQFQQQQQQQQQQQNNLNNSNHNSGSNNNRNSRSIQNNNSRQYEHSHNNIPYYNPQQHPYPRQQQNLQYVLQNCETPPHSSIRNHQLSSNILTSFNANSSIGSSTSTTVINSNSSGPNNCHNVAVPLPHIYGGSSQSAHDLEQGTMGPINVTRHQQHHPETQHLVANEYNIIENNETQLLPSHLKCGMWASLIVASVCVAGAKFYFDHQGTGLEVFIFFTFLAIFFWAACTVSLCPCPKKLPTRPSSPIININRQDDIDVEIMNGMSNRNASIQNHRQTFTDNNPEQFHQDIQLLSAATAAPPPYHIAILLPDTTKELVEIDETPPPSYDKVLI